MESKAQVRKVASGELDAVQVEFDTEIAEWPILVCGKCVDRLWRKQDERARFYVVDGIVAAHEKRTFLQIKNLRKIVPVGFDWHGKTVGAAGKGFNRRVQDVTVFKKILQRKSPPSGKKYSVFFWEYQFRKNRNILFLYSRIISYPNEN